MTETGRAARIDTALRTAFAPAALTVEDESARHAGHSGARPGGETHFRITMSAPGFAGLSRVARARRVHEVLAAEFASGLHALSLSLASPDDPTP